MGRECRRCRVGSTECSVQVMEDSSIGVGTWLQLMCCTLAREQGCPQFQSSQAGETQGDCIVRGKIGRGLGVKIEETE